MSQCVEINALNIDEFDIDKHCVGSKWTVDNEDQLAKLIAIVVMGQALEAARIIETLSPAQPAFTNDDLKNEAVVKFTVQEHSQTPRIGYPRYQRDGLIFEIISWVAAKQVSGDRCFLKDPHISATSQGLDGIMIELSDDRSELLKSTIFEDKCTENPRNTFRNNVMPGFLERHSNKRSADVVAAAASLIQLSGATNSQAMSMAKKVFDNDCRQYRAGFSLTRNFDNSQAQKSLFKGYKKIKDIDREQRIGACFIVDNELRDWFDIMAIKIITFIHQFD